MNRDCKSAAGGACYAHWYKFQGSAVNHVRCFFDPGNQSPGPSGLQDSYIVLPPYRLTSPIKNMLGVLKLTRNFDSEKRVVLRLLSNPGYLRITRDLQLETGTAIICVMNFAMFFFSSRSILML